MLGSMTKYSVKMDKRLRMNSQNLWVVILRGPEGFQAPASKDEALAVLLLADALSSSPLPGPAPPAHTQKHCSVCHCDSWEKN